MKFLLDENFPRKAAEVLAAQGHEVLDVRGTADEGANDQWLFEYAQKSKAILVTTDRDFYHTIPARAEKHHGVIVIALRQPNGPAIVSKFEAALRFIENFNLRSNVVLLTDSRVYTHTK